MMKYGSIISNLDLDVVVGVGDRQTEIQSVHTRKDCHIGRREERHVILFKASLLQNSNTFDVMSGLGRGGNVGFLFQCMEWKPGFWMSWHVGSEVACQIISIKLLKISARNKEQRLG